MKKVLSIILSLVLVMGTICAVPAFSALAEEPTEDGADIANATWYDSTGAQSTNNGIYNPAEGNTVNVLSWLQYRSMYTKLVGLETNTTYQITFGYSNVAVEATGTAVVAATDAKPTFSNQIVQNATYGRTTVDSTNKKVTIYFTTDANTDYFLCIKTGASTADFNFNGITMNKVEKDVELGNAIADGEWKGTNVWTKFAHNYANHSVKITDMAYQKVYTTMSGLKPNTTYVLTYDHNLGTNAHLFSNPILIYAGADVISGDYIARGSSNAISTSVTFTTNSTDTDYTLHLTSHKCDGDGNGLDANSALAANVTLSNFILHEKTEAELAGEALANGNWAVTQGAGGTITKANGTVTVTGAQYQKISVALTGLEKNTYYTVSLNHTAGDMYQFANRIRVIPNETTFTGDDLFNKEGALIFRAEEGINTATTTTFKFFAEEETYLLVFVCAAPSYNGTLGTVVLSNFNVEKGAHVTDAELAGNAIADGEWKGTNQWTQFAHDTANHSVKITDMAYQNVYTTISGLKTNTTYVLSYDHNLEEEYHLFSNPLYVYAGANVISGDYIAKGNYLTNSNNTSTSITFTTNDTDTDYTLYLTSHKCDGDGNGLDASSALDANVTLSNFKLETTVEFVGTAIRAASEETTQGMRFKNTISKDALVNGINGKEVVEYGNLVAYEKNITTDFTYENVDDKKIKKGVAFNKNDGTNVVFAEDDESITYTAVLVGINAKHYGLNCVVRSYMVLSDGSVIYGDVQTYSVYSMFNAILNGNNDDDKAVVNNILADETINAGYNAWLSENN